MRILDAILANDNPATAEFRRGIEGMESFSIDNVAEYVHGAANADRESWDIKRDFPCLAPPFSDFWMEYARPAKIIRKDGLRPSTTAPHRAAIRFLARQADPDQNGRWVVTCNCCFQCERGQQIIVLGALTLLVDDRGEAVTYECDYQRDALAESIAHDDEKLRHALLTLCTPALLAISFLHCKNVVAEREQPPSPKLAKRQRERGKPPRVIFKTLNIAPMKAVLEKTMAETSTGLRRALHICRGHFADYGEHGLFGKYQGRFWIPQHLRGGPDRGIVHKTYNVKAPAQ